MFTSCGNKDPDEIVDDVERVVLVEDGNDTWELRPSDTDGKLDVYHNEKKTTSYEHEYTTGEILKLADTSETNDFLGIPIITEGVYKTDIKSGTMYINYLKSNGYTVDRTAYTTKFIEIFLSNKDADMTQRVIITQDYVVIGKLDYGDIPNMNITDYLF